MAAVCQYGRVPASTTQYGEQHTSRYWAILHTQIKAQYSAVSAAGISLTPSMQQYAAVCSSMQQFMLASMLASMLPELVMQP